MTLRRRSSVVRSNRRALLLVEPMESRTLLAASLNGGVLTIAGTGGNDAYTVKLSGSNLVVQCAGEAAQSFAKASVAKIIANLGGGNDSILIDDAVEISSDLRGEAGNDTLRGGIFSDTIDGGSGSDTVTYAGRFAGIEASLTLRSSTSDQDPTPVAGGSGGTPLGRPSDVPARDDRDSYVSVETIVGGSGDDTITLGGPDNFQSGSSTTPSQIRGEGGAGNDTFLLGSGYTTDTNSVSITAYGDAGNDIFDFGGNRDPVLAISLYGGAGDDAFYSNTTDGNYGLIDGGTGTDLLSFNSLLPRTYVLPAGVENFDYGGTASVTIVGNELANRITLSSAGSAYGATIRGMGGNDTIVGGSGNDSIDGGEGNDTVTYANRTAAITVTLKQHSFYYSGQDATPVAVGSGGQAGETDGYSSVETIVGGSGNDTISLGGSDPYNNSSSTSNPIRGEGGAGDDTFFIASGFNSNNSRLSITAYGDAGNDTFDVRSNVDSPVPATVYGGEGDDTYIDDSFDGYSTFVAGAGVDTVRQNLRPQFPGGGGSYSLAPDVENAEIGGPAFLTIYGNDLNNRITPVGTQATVYGMGGDDTIIDGHYVDAGAGNDRVTSGGGNVTVLGGGGDDTIVTGSGDDSIDAGSGNDRVEPGAGDDTIGGGSGADAVVYSSRTNAVTGTLTASLIQNGSTYSVRRDLVAKFTVNGNAETDVGTDVEVLTGSLGNDTLTAQAGPGDWNAAGAANVDRSPLILNGGNGNDLLNLRGIDPKTGVRQNTPVMLANGNGGDDALYAYYDPRDTIDGGEGNDTLGYIGNFGVANVVGGNNTDTLYIKRYAGPGESITYTMPGTLENLVMTGPGHVDVIGNALANNISVQSTTDWTWIRGLGGNDTLSGGDSTDALDGGDGDDLLYGNNGNDRLWGFAGRDTLYGGSGVDQLFGGNDNDRLDGGSGSDSIYGENGTDTYVKDPSDALVGGVEAYA